MLPSLYIEQPFNHETLLSDSFKNIFAETWMDLESVLQSDLNQKEKNKYYILMHMCGIQKNGTDKAICKAKVETQKLRTNVCTSKAEWGIG